MNCSFYSCEDHIDCVIDDLLNLRSITPNIDFVSCYDKKYCEYCSKCAKYIVSVIKD